MKVSEKIEILRKHKIFNTYEMLNKGELSLYYSNGGVCLSRSWQLSKKGYSFNNVPWYDYGCLSFNEIGKKRKEILVIALEYVKKNFGVTLVRGIYGGYISEEANQRIEKIIKESKDDKQEVKKP